MSGRRFTRWVLPLLMLGVLLLLLLLILYPVQIQRRPELLEMSVIAGRRTAPPGPPPARAWSRRRRT